jgi:hypothetical protein
MSLVDTRLVLKFAGIGTIPARDSRLSELISSAWRAGRTTQNSTAQRVVWRVVWRVAWGVAWCRAQTWSVHPRFLEAGVGGRDIAGVPRHFRWLGTTLPAVEQLDRRRMVGRRRLHQQCACRVDVGRVGAE